MIGIEPRTTGEESVRDVVIAGSGVAGLSAAVYAARADLDPLVLEGAEPGGQLTLTAEVENFLGFPDGVSGSELVQRGKRQAERFGADFRMASIEAADLDERPFELALNTGDVVRTRALVVATGASARTIDAENEDELMGFGLSTCATCDGAFHRGDDVVVVGGGDAAMEEAVFLTRFADSVTVVHRREELRASPILIERARENDDVSFRWNTELAALHGSRDEGVTGATLVHHPAGYPRDRRADGESVETMDVDVGGVFYAVGHEPNTEFLADTPVPLDDDGYVVTESGMTSHTAVEGVFAAGDVMDRDYQQAITAAGTGSMAALDVEQYLERASEERVAPTAAD